MHLNNIYSSRIITAKKINIPELNLEGGTIAIKSMQEKLAGGVGPWEFMQSKKDARIYYTMAIYNANFHKICQLVEELFLLALVCLDDNCVFAGVVRLSTFFYSLLLGIL